MKKIMKVILVLFLSFLMFPLSMGNNINNKNDTEIADINSPISAGELEETWTKTSSVNLGRSVYIQGEFIYAFLQSTESAVILTKIADENGEVVFEKTISPAGVGVSKDSICGTSEAIYTIWRNSSSHSLISKYDNDGNLVWSLALKRYGINSYGVEEPVSPCIWCDEEYVYGFKKEDRYSNITLVAMRSSNGSIAWEKELYNNGNVHRVWGNDDHVYVFGDIDDEENVMYKIANNGDLVWEKRVNYYQDYQSLPGAIYGNGDSLFTITFICIDIPKREITSRWDFDGNIIWNLDLSVEDSEFHESRPITSVWCDDDEVYVLGIAGLSFYTSSLLVTKLDITSGKIVWEQEREECSTSECCLRGSKDGLYGTGSFGVAKWSFDEGILDSIDDIKARDDFLFISLTIIAILAVIIVVAVIIKKKGFLIKKQLQTLKNI